MQAALVCWFSRAAAAASETAPQGRPPNPPKPIGEGFSAHLPKGYIYFAVALSFAVERFNIRMR